MGLILKQIFQFIKLLNSDTATGQLASGVACGFILGMTPSFSLTTVLVIAVLFLFRIQIGAAFVSAFFFKFIAFLLDPLFNWVGRGVLEMEALQGLFTALYNMPIIPFTRFNNSIVMGALVISVILSPFVYVLARILIEKYRKTVVERFKQTKLWKAIKATSFYKWYYKYDSLYN